MQTGGNGIEEEEKEEKEEEKYRDVLRKKERQPCSNIIFRA